MLKHFIANIHFLDNLLLYYQQHDQQYDQSFYAVLEETYKRMTSLQNKSIRYTASQMYKIPYSRQISVDFQPKPIQNSQLGLSAYSDYVIDNEDIMKNIA